MANPSTLTEAVFQLFQHLPRDIRLLIWDCTWPEPRIITPGSPTIICETWVETGDSLISYLEWFYLGRGGHMGASKGYNTTIPVALHVCSESRSHGYSKYRLIPHPELLRGGFFCASFDRDVLYITDHKDLRQFRSFDRHPLHGFKTVAVMDFIWKKHSPETYAHIFLGDLPCVETILLVLSTDDIEQSTSCSDENDVKQANLSRLKQHASDKRAEYSEFFQRYQGIRKTILCLDHTGGYY